MKTMFKGMNLRSQILISNFNNFRQTNKVIWILSTVRSFSADNLKYNTEISVDKFPVIMGCNF